MDLGIYIRWNTPTHEVTQAAMYDYIKDFIARGTAATDDWRERNKDNPIVNRSLKLGREQTMLQEELEKKYFSAEMLEKYAGSAGVHQ
jgi:hypothetical protein